jgi:hypothetical protein
MYVYGCPVTETEPRPGQRLDRRHHLSSKSNPLTKGPATAATSSPLLFSSLLPDTFPQSKQRNRKQEKRAAPHRVAFVSLYLERAGII